MACSKSALACPVVALFGPAAISKLSLLSGLERMLDLDPAKGRLWRKAAIGQNIDVSEVPYADSLFPDFATSRLQNGTAARAR